jgi:hypothetical protein
MLMENTVVLRINSPDSDAEGESDTQAENEGEA